jgi:hypothetical protein
MKIWKLIWQNHVRAAYLVTHKIILIQVNNILKNKTEFRTEMAEKASWDMDLAFRGEQIWSGK